MSLWNSSLTERAPIVCDGRNQGYYRELKIPFLLIVFEQEYLSMVLGVQYLEHEVRLSEHLEASRDTAHRTSPFSPVGGRP